MVIIRGAQASADAVGADAAPAGDPLEEEAARVFADDLAADHVPSIRAIRAQLHVGQTRAQRVRTHMVAVVNG
jgi:hypothetical protein